MSDCFCSCSTDKLDNKPFNDSGLGVSSCASPEYMPIEDAIDQIEIEFKDELRISKLEDFSDYDLKQFSVACCSASLGPEIFPFDALPELLQLKVFEYLQPQNICKLIAPVCKKWYKLAYCPLLWKKLILSLEDLSECWNVKRVLTNATHLVSFALSLDGFGVNNELILGGQLIPFLPSVRELNLRFIRGLDISAVDFFMDQCPNLTELNLEGVKEVTDKGVEIFSKVWFKLEVLNLSHCEYLTDASLESLAQNCRRIRKLNIDGVNKVTDLGIESLMKSFGGNLTELRLDGEDLSDLALWCICDWAKRLTLLTLSFSESLTDTALNYIQRMPLLTHLHLRKGMDFNAEALVRLFDSGSLSNLRNLNLAECHGINDVVVDAITNCCQKLETLCLSWCWTITDTGLQYIAERLPFLCLLSLEGLKLPLGTSSFNRVCMQNDILPRIQYIDLRMCNAIEDEILEQLVVRKRDLSILNYYGEVLSQDIQATLPRNAMYELKRKVIDKYEGKCCITGL